MQMTMTEVAQTLGELIKMGLIEAVTEDGQPTRYRLTGRPGDEHDKDEEEEEESEARVSAVTA